MTTLDVMLLESDPGAADEAAKKLREAGHRVHRCHEPGLGAFPCNGTLDPKRCPLMGPIDVALVVRRHPYPRPTRLEQDGVSCAIRAGVPLVADGAAVLDPFEPWEVGRASGGDVSSACEEAASHGETALGEQILARVDTLLVAAGVEPGEVSCRVEHAGLRTRVVFSGPLPDGLQSALSVRALDAVRAVGRTFGQVDVAVEPAVREPALRPQ
jgi:hypothetical protein